MKGYKYRSDYLAMKSGFLMLSGKIKPLADYDQSQRANERCNSFEKQGEGMEEKFFKYVRI